MRQGIEPSKLNTVAAIMTQTTKPSKPDIVAAFMTQLLLKAELKQQKGKAKAKAKSEMKQTHLKDTFKPLHCRELNETQKKTILESRMFLKDTKGRMIGRTMAEGNEQRDFISKEGASSPTNHTEKAVLQCTRWQGHHS